MTLTAEKLKEVLTYDGESGDFYWRQKKKGRPSGRAAGCVSKTSGYRTICIDYKIYYAHRLAWLYMTVEWPKNQVDHVNGMRSDNSFRNLREATSQQNNVNRVSRGCHLDSRGKWGAYMSVNNKTRNLGRFETEELANQAYLSACKKVHGAEWVNRKVKIG